MSCRAIWFAAALAVLLAATACSDEPVRLNGFSEEAAQRQVELEDRLIGAPNALRLQDHHKALTQAAPAVGSEANAQNAQYFADELDEFGFDSIEVHRFGLVQPRIEVQELDFLGRAPQLLLPLAEPDPNDAVLRVAASYLTDGEVSAEVVFANRGYREDYEVLAERQVGVEGRVVLVRADSTFGADVMEQAATRGAVGMLLFTDGPTQDWVGFGTEAIPYAAPAPANRIPLLPIPAATAETILTALSGATAPAAWRDASKSVQHLGPAPGPLRMRVVYDRSTIPIVNVVGLLIGADRPDEWVMVGGHRDDAGLGAWGAASGAAIRLESARIIARQVRRGFRPQRTIAVASWDASTLSGLGWKSWANRPGHAHSKIVAYLNQDGYAAGEFSAVGSPAFQPLINDIARRVEFPRGDEVVYNRWRDQQLAAVAADSDGGRGPLVDHGGWTDVRLGWAKYNSGFAPLRVPSASLSFGAEARANAHLEDSHEAFKREGDPRFDTGQQLAELTALFLTRVANAEVPPLDHTATAETIASGLDAVEGHADEVRIELRLGPVREATQSFGLNAAALNAAIDEVLARPEERRKESAGLISALTATLVSTERDIPFPTIHAALEAGDRREAQAAVDALEAQLSEVVDGIGEVLELAVTPPDSP